MATRGSFKFKLETTSCRKNQQICTTSCPKNQQITRKQEIEEEKTDYSRKLHKKVKYFEQNFITHTNNQMINSTTLYILFV